jgi:hypothetical protein
MVVISVQRPIAADDQLVVRTRAEYLEMPGLTLTVPQAARLFDLPVDACTVTLDALVASGFLQKSGETYCRAGSGSRGLTFEA